MEAVVSVSQGAMGSLLGKLNNLLAEEYARLKGARREIRFLRSEMNNMHALLHKLAMMEEPDIQVKAWTREVRELAYDIEDCIDNFIHQLGNDEHRGSGGIKEFFRKSARRLKTLGSRRQIVDKIEELKARVVQVKDQRLSYRLDDVDCGSCRHTAVDPRLCALFAEEDQLVGIDGPRDELAEWVVEGESGGLAKHPKVLSIVGFGGLGKTTLARELCRTVEGRFDCNAFVSVSQKPHIKKILRDIIFQLPYEKGFTEGIETWDEPKLITKLKELLQDKRYLIIIDDVWSTPTWELIKCAFSKNSYCSRIITTTRIIDVARSCSSSRGDRIYEMESLNEVHSKRLFFRRIFGSDDCCHNQLQEVSNEILKKCGGLPLAIISISGLLANRPPLKEEWEKVGKSIGFALEKHQSLEGMKSILSLSYNDLPCHLKTCLLYLSIFPEDTAIERDSLVRRWIAEGFISEERGQSYQDLAESYFYELINKSMVQPIDIGYDGKARACRVHDMMLELIISKASEENFVSVLGSQMNITNQHGNIRRLSVQCTEKEGTDVLSGKDLCHARLLIAFSHTKCLPPLAEFEALRVLDLQDCEVLEGYDLTKIGKLFQLKYLSLRNTWIGELPTEIVNLQNLETLDLRGTKIRELPVGIVQLAKLLNLLLSEYTKLPDGIRNLRNLQVLHDFDISASSASAVGELGHLTNLKELCISFRFHSEEFSDNKRQEMLLSSLCKLGSCKLKSLYFYSPSSLEFLDPWHPPPYFLQTFYMSTSYYFPEIPKWMASLTSITYLDINLREVTERDLHILGELPALIFLELWSQRDPKERLTILGTEFPSLKEFELVCSRYEGGAYLTFEERAMPKIERLRLPFLVSIAKKYDFYFGIKHLLCLKYAEVSLYSVDADDSDTKAAAKVIRNEANTHPNHPRVTIEGEEHSEEEEVDTDNN